MKKSVYISGIVCAILISFGCTFKIMHWPGASVMIIASVLTFCFLFLPAGLMASYQESEEKKHKGLHLLTYLVFLICMMGVLFKVMHWPGASFFLFAGILLPFVVFLPVYLYATREQNRAGNKNFMGIMFGMIFLAAFTVFLSVNVSKKVVSQAVINVSNNEKTAALSKAVNPEEPVRKSAEALYVYIDELKCELLNAAGEEMCREKTLSEAYRPEQITNTDNREPARYVFFGEEGQQRTNILKQRINLFRESLLASKRISPELAELAQDLFFTGEKQFGADDDLYTVSWEEREISGYSLIFTLDFLTLLQSNVRLAERELINQ